MPPKSKKTGGILSTDDDGDRIDISEVPIAAMLPVNFRMLVLGGTGAGKSLNLKWMLQNWQHHRRVRHSVHRGSQNNDYDYIHPMFHYQGAQYGRLRELCRKQLQKSVFKQEVDPTMDIDKNVIFDDMSSDSEFMNSELLDDMMSKGRQFYISTILLAQTMKHFKGKGAQKLLGNFDIVVIMGGAGEDLLDIRKTFFPNLKPKLLQEIIDRCTQNYGAFVYHKADRRMSFFRIPADRLIPNPTKPDKKMLPPGEMIGVPSGNDFANRHYYNDEVERMRKLVEQRKAELQKLERKRLKQLQLQQQQQQPSSSSSAAAAAAAVTVVDDDAFSCSAASDMQSTAFSLLLNDDAANVEPAGPTEPHPAAAAAAAEQQLLQNNGDDDYNDAGGFDGGGGGGGVEASAAEHDLDYDYDDDAAQEEQQEDDFDDDVQQHQQQSRPSYMMDSSADDDDDGDGKQQQQQQQQRTFLKAKRRHHHQA